MIQPVSAVSSSFAWTFSRNSSAGQARQFGPQWRVSRLICGIFSILESRAPSVVYRHVRHGRVAGSNRKNSVQVAISHLSSPCMIKHSDRAKGRMQSSFVLIFIRVHGFVGSTHRCCRRSISYTSPTRHQSAVSGEWWSSIRLT